MWPFASTKRLLDTGADDARDDHESKRHKNSDETVPMAQGPSSGSGVKRSNLEAIRRGDAEAEKALKLANVLEEDMTVTFKEQARQKQLDFLESMKVFEEVYEDELPAGTHVMSGRWVDTMKTPTMWRSKYTARGYEEPHSDEGCYAATATMQGTRMLLARCLDKRDQGHEAVVANYTQAFLNFEVREGEQLYAEPPEGWNPKNLMDGRRVVWRVRKAMLGLRTSPRRWQEHVSGKLKEHSFVQDERDPCLFVNSELGICIGVHVDDMLAVGPSELTKILLQELSKDLTMRWCMVTDKPQESLGRSLCRTPQGSTFGVSQRLWVLANSRDRTHSFRETG